MILNKSPEKFPSRRPRTEVDRICVIAARMLFVTGNLTEVLTFDYKESCVCVCFNMARRLEIEN